MMPKHAGIQLSVPKTLLEAIQKQRRDHPKGSSKLHYQNMGAVMRNTVFIVGYKRF